MGFKDTLNPEEQAFTESFSERIRTGVLSKRTMPNTSDVFDEERVYESLKTASADTDLHQVMKNAYK